MSTRFSKILMFAVGVGLWINIGAQWLPALTAEAIQARKTAPLDEPEAECLTGGFGIGKPSFPLVIAPKSWGAFRSFAGGIVFETSDGDVRVFDTDKCRIHLFVSRR